MYLNCNIVNIITHQLSPPNLNMSKRITNRHESHLHNLRLIPLLQSKIILYQNLSQTKLKFTSSKETSRTLMSSHSEMRMVRAGLNKQSRIVTCFATLVETVAVEFVGVLVRWWVEHFTTVDGDVSSFAEGCTVGENCVADNDSFQEDCKRLVMNFTSRVKTYQEEESVADTPS